MRMLLALFASTILAGELTAQDREQKKEIAEAEKALRIGLRKEDVLEVGAACRRLVAVGHPACVEVLTEALEDVTKAETKVHRQLIPLRRERAKIDKMMTAAHRRGGRSLHDQIEKLDREVIQVNREMLPFAERIRGYSEHRARVAESLSALLKALDDDVREEVIASLCEEAEDREDESERLALLHAVASTGRADRTQELITRLTAKAEEDFVVRVLDSFSSHEVPGSAPFARRMMAHESWFVRAAALAVLRRQQDFDSIPELIDALEGSEGRLQGDIMGVLSGMTGVDYRDNAPLWRRWWNPAQKKLRDILQRLDDDQPVAHAAAMDEAAEAGFLLGAHRVLQALGLIPSASGRGLPESTDSSGGGARASDPGGAGAGGVDSVASQRSVACEVVGRAIRNAHRNVRDQAVRELILRPLRDVTRSAHRRELLRILADVQCGESLQLLGDIAAGSRVAGSFGKDDRAFALRSLAEGQRDIAVAVLVGLMDRPIHEEHGALVLETLEKIDSRKAVDGLIRLLGRFEDARKSEDPHPLSRFENPLRPALYAALGRLTGEGHGSSPTRWQQWWREHGLRFQTEREKTAVASGPGEWVDEPGTGASFYGIPTRSKRLCFILDVSGSMNGPTEWAGYEGAESATKINVARKQILDTIRSLPADAWFTIIFYSSGFKMWKPRLVQASPEVKKEAREWAEKITAGGATNIFDPLSKAFELAGRGAFDRGYEVALDTIFFMSDGQPTTGLLVDPQRIIDEILSINTLKRVQINTVGVGPGHDADFMRELARATGGTYIAR